MVKNKHDALKARVLKKIVYFLLLIFSWFWKVYVKPKTEKYAIIHLHISFQICMTDRMLVIIIGIRYYYIFYKLFMFFYFCCSHFSRSFKTDKFYLDN